MIKQSDIVITTVGPRNHGESQLVRAELTVGGEVTIARNYIGDARVHELAKIRARTEVLLRLYGDLIEPIKELEYMARMSQYSDPEKLRSIHAEINRIMEGRDE